jgi:hypothetical protein
VSKNPRRKSPRESPGPPSPRPSKIQS